MFAAVPAVYFLCNLDDFFLLQGLCNLDEFAGAAVQEGLVHIPYGTQAHDDIPAQGFLENLVRARLVHKVRHPGRVLPRGQLQQQAVVVRHNAPNLEIARGRDQLAIIIVRGFTQRIIVCISLTAGFQQFHLVLVAGFAELLDGALRLDVVPVERHVLLHQLMHALFQHTSVPSALRRWQK